MPLISQIKNRIDGDILINKDDSNKLIKDSLLKMHHIQSFDRGRFTKYVGKAGETVMSEVKKYLHIHFGL